MYLRAAVELPVWIWSFSGSTLCSGSSLSVSFTAAASAGLYCCHLDRCQDQGSADGQLTRCRELGHDFSVLHGQPWSHAGTIWAGVSASKILILILSG